MRGDTTKITERIPVLVYNGKTWIETSILYTRRILLLSSYPLNSNDVRKDILNFVGNRLIQMKCTRYIIMLPKYLEN